MVKTLLKKQFAEIFRSYFYDTKKNKARSKLGTALYIVMFVVIMVVVLGGMFAMMSWSLCAALAAADALWLYFALTGTIAILLGVFGSVFNTYSGLYLAKDNDLLLSMPIPTSAIMLSRLMGVYLMGLMYSAVAIVPAIVVCLITVPFSVRTLLGCIVLLVLISVFVLTLSCLLGWVVAKLSLKLKNKSIVTVVIALVFIALYYFVYFKAINLIQELIANIAVYGPAIREKAYGVYLFGSVGVGDPIAIAVCTAVVAAFFGLMWYLLGHSFLNVATATGASEKVKYAARRERQHSAASALLKKEFGRLTSSANYMLNCAMSTLLIPILAVLILIKGPGLLDALGAVFGGMSGAVTVLFAAALCMAASMNDTTASSVSLEGRSIWIPQSLPVDPWQVLRAKLRVQLILTMPGLLLASVCAAIMLKAPAGETLALLVLPQVFALFFALLGLTLNLKRPSLQWTNELAPIKQSMPVGITLLGGMALVTVFALLYLLLTPPFGAAAYLWGFAALMAIPSLALYFWLRRKGGKLFMEL
jgi:ABC-2 type transport system permease protein